MIFGDVALAAALGGILAHNLPTGSRMLRKGALIDAEILALLRAAGYHSVTIARLEPGDVPEGQAAAHLGDLLEGPSLLCTPELHGRVNLVAGAAGLLRVDAAMIDRLNRVDESITLATLPDRGVVRTGEMVATLKIIPFAVARDRLAEFELLVRGRPPVLAVKPFRPLCVGLVMSRLPQLKPSVLAKTARTTQARIASYGGRLLPPLETAHETAALAGAIKTLLAAETDLILIAGSSAVTDRQDIAPSAIIAAGGEIIHFGMPVDPGNLICFGMAALRPVIIMPGCARSPALNGIDWVLDRLFAGEPVGPAEITGMGAGGLLKEFAPRPAPRAATAPTGYGPAPRALPRIAALVMAAGQSSRMGNINKLLTMMPDGQTMIAQTVDRVAACGARPVLVVTGHQDAEIRQALAGKPVSFVHAADYASGLSASLHAGIAALSADIGAALICLGDMPLIETAMLRQLISTYDPLEGRGIILPCFDGQRGNPVLWDKRFFPDLLALSGDAGARRILHHHMDFVAEVPVESDSVLRDFDTPEMILQLAR
jgi:molybdenum cofactor cytidylyltransferase